MTDHQPLSGQIALVTGAAGGIGSVICRRLAEAGASVILADLRETEETQVIASSLPGEGHIAVKVAIDDSHQLKALAEQIEHHHGKLDILVNNAGITRPVPHDDLDGLDDELIDAIFRVNWRGGFACIRAFRKLLEKNGNGLVINISSIAGTTAVGSNVAYCASKAAVNSMTMSLARVLAPKIRMVAIAPGWVLGEYAKRVDPAYLQEQTEQTPMARLATPDDVAEAIIGIAVHLPFTTGTVIPVDGGRPLGV